MAGVEYVLHVATPMGITATSGGADALIRPAVDGTTRVLRAAAAAGVRRVVMTSAANAASPSSYATDGVTDETLWTDPDDPKLIPYRRAKTLAERAAWELAAQPGAPELTTVLPGAVFGPILSPSTVGSVGIVARMLDGRVRRVPRIGFEVVDVRDLVDLHLRAMQSPAAAGERFLGTGEFVWMRDMAAALRSELGAAAARVSTRGAPDFLVRLAARRDAALREIAPALGRRNRHSTAKARDLLGWQSRPALDTVVDCARSLLHHGVVTT
jgi:dihydroflavonol-4-reductase